MVGLDCWAPPRGNKKVVQLSKVGRRPGAPTRGLRSPRGAVGDFLLVGPGEQRANYYQRVGSSCL
eukprot:12033384-Alexandrium_andersonii.AAC.1